MGEGTQESPHTRPGVGKPGRERKQKRNKPVSRPDPNDKIHPWNVLGDKAGPTLGGGERLLLGDRRCGRQQPVKEGSLLQGDQEERTQGTAGK